MKKRLLSAVLVLCMALTLLPAAALAAAIQNTTSGLYTISYNSGTTSGSHSNELVAPTISGTDNAPVLTFSRGTYSCSGGVITSRYTMDFTRSFNIEGSVTFAERDGVSFALHTTANKTSYATDYNTCMLGPALLNTWSRTVDSFTVASSQNDITNGLLWDFMQYQNPNYAPNTRFQSGAYSYRIVNRTTVQAQACDESPTGILNPDVRNTSGAFRLQWVCTDAATAVGKLTLTMGNTTFNYTGLNAAFVFGSLDAAKAVYFSFSTWLPSFSTGSGETIAETKIAVDRAYYTDTAGDGGSTLGVATAYFIDTDGNGSYETQLKDTTMVSANQTILCRNTITNKNKNAASSFSTSLLIPSLKSYAGSGDTTGTAVASISGEKLYWHEHGATGETDKTSLLASYNAGPLNSTAPYTNYAAVTLPAGGDGTSLYDDAYAVYEYIFTLGANVTRLAQTIQIGVAPFTPAVISSSVSFNTPMAFDVTNSGGVQYSADGTDGIAVYRVMAKGRADATLLKSDVSSIHAYDEAWLNGAGEAGYLGTYFSAVEQAAVLPYAADPLDTALVYPSGSELTAWGFVDDTSRTAAGGDWWLRDVGSAASAHVGVAADGALTTADGYADSGEHGVRPALRLNLADVLLTVPAATKTASAAPGPDALTALAEEAANTIWKLTLLDSADAFRLTQDGASLTVNTGSALSFTYSGFAPGDNRYISAILADNTGKDIYYGQLAKPADGSGSVSCNVPMGLSNGTYILKIFAEAIDPAKASDVGSQIQTVRLTVGNNLEGEVAVSGTYEYGCTLTATVTGDNRLGELAYQWTRGGVNIQNATSASYTAAADDIGSTLACVVTDTGAAHRDNSIFSAGAAHRDNSIFSAGAAVEKRTLTFKADDKSMPIGGEFPEFTVSVSGFVNGDTQDAIVSVLGTADCAEDGKTSGTFPITLSGSGLAASGNALYYRVLAQNGTFSVYVPDMSKPVPLSSEKGSVSASASVSGGVAVVAVTDKQIAGLISESEATGTVTADLSALGTNAAILPQKLVGAAAKDSDGLTAKLSSGSVTLDKTALGSVSGSGSIKISVEKVDNGKLTAAQKSMTGENGLVVDVNLFVNGEKMHDFSGGKITVSVPYTLKTGENPDSIAVWYLEDGGSLTPMNGKYDPASGTVTFTTTHLSQYVIGSFPFTDVPENAYYYAAVVWAVNNRVTEGTSATTFSPDGACTRAEAATFLWRAMGSPEPTGTVCPFADVSGTAWYYKAVLWAAEKGITEGTGETTFSPDRAVTRAEAAALLWRAAGRPAAGASNPFADVDTDAWYGSAVAWAAAEKITEGTDAAAFSPAAICTRAQIAAFLWRWLGK